MSMFTGLRLHTKEKTIPDTQGEQERAVFLERQHNVPEEGLD